MEETQPPSDSSPLRSVAHFFALALGITWVLQLPGVLAQEGILPGRVEAYMPLVLLGVFGPLIAAWILTRKSEGPEGVRRLFASLVRPRPPLGWLLAALVAPGAVLSLGLVIHHFMGGQSALAYPPDPPARLIAAVLISLGEEVGWRGYALPHLSKGVGRLRASLIIGVVWALWHLPMFVGQGTPLTLMPYMFVFFCAGSVLFSWFYFRTGGSLLVALLLHLGTHLNNSHLALPADSTPFFIHLIGLSLLAIGLVSMDRKIW
jgi:uncharacterized protein